MVHCCGWSCGSPTVLSMKSMKIHPRINPGAPSTLEKCVAESTAKCTAKVLEDFD